MTATTQVIYVLDGPIKAALSNETFVQRGDYPVLSFVAKSGTAMTRALAFAWNENKHADNILFVANDAEIAVKTNDIPRILTQGCNEANRCPDRFSWLQNTLAKL